MVPENITKHKIIQHFKSHKLYFLLMSIGGWFMGDLLNTPAIKAFSVILLAFFMLAISIDVLFKPKIGRWIESEKHYYYIIYSVLTIICILCTIPFWDELVYLCDRDNPYKQPLLTGEGKIEIKIEPKSSGSVGGSIKSFGGWGIFLLVNENNEIILEMGGIVGREEIENNQWIYFVLPKLDAKDEPVNKPVYCLTKAKYAVIQFERLPPYSKIVDGEAVFSFNSSIRTKKISIPPQIMDGNSIIIEDIRKYFKKRNEL